MSIRPVDMQIVVPKTIEYSKQVQENTSRQNTEQTVFMQMAQREIEHKQSMVIETKASEPSVDKDGRNKQEFDDNKKRKRKKNEANDADVKKSKGSSLFDMRI